MKLKGLTVRLTTINKKQSTNVFSWIFSFLTLHKIKHITNIATEFVLYERKFKRQTYNLKMKGLEMKSLPLPIISKLNRR